MSAYRSKIVNIQLYATSPLTLNFGDICRNLSEIHRILSEIKRTNRRHPLFGRCACELIMVICSSKSWQIVMNYLFRHLKLWHLSEMPWQNVVNRDLFRIDRSSYMGPCHFSLVLTSFYNYNYKILQLQLLPQLQLQLQHYNYDYNYNNYILQLVWPSYSLDSFYGRNTELGIRVVRSQWFSKQTNFFGSVQWSVRRFYLVRSSWGGKWNIFLVFLHR